MRLERLEICGFKSFSDRAELAFDRGVTAIVGPNGCGKSNVADAITWVLGEQSAKSLRGDRMEDVIFSGSDARKPGAAAEVRLRLVGVPVPPKNDGGYSSTLPGASPSTSLGAGGNGNGHHPDASSNGHGEPDIAVETMARTLTRDVEVTRRLYRSGESEYLIDGQVCRLRDIHELLMDTGLGAKAYAIIEQGKIGMILSSRPTDRRQLIEEAAGITKYKARRRAAELKLEAAQQNLTRIDDIVFEVERQRGALKRQAAKARRYRRLRDELRRWEKVLFAHRYRELAQSIEGARARLAEARAREMAASAQLAGLESELARLRLEQAAADARAAQLRDDVHARELEINRRQQQLQFNRQQAEALLVRSGEIAGEIRDLEARREPAHFTLEARRAAASEAFCARDEAAQVAAATAEEHEQAAHRIASLEADVERARGDSFRAQNAITALRHVLEHAAAQRDRIGEALARLDVEQDDLGREIATVEAERVAAAEALSAARRVLGEVMAARAAAEADLAAARSEHERCTRDLRVREQELAGIEARLASLEELAESRADFGDAARMVLMEANGHVGQQGAVADYVEVDPRYERAVEACLGDLLQHIIVERHEHAAAGLALVREHNAGRCGFVVIDPGTNGHHPQTAVRAPGIVPISDVVRLQGPHAGTLAAVLPEAFIAETFEQAVAFAREASAVVATLDGDVVRGAHLVAGGTRGEARGILATRREIKELRERAAADREALARVFAEAERLEAVVARSTALIADLVTRQHGQEKALVSLEAQVARASEEVLRLSRKQEVVALERRRAEEERATLDARRAAAEASIDRHLAEQQEAEERVAATQNRLAEARAAVAALAAKAAEARAAHAALVERAAALAAEAERLEEGARELEERIAARAAEYEQTRARRAALVAAIHADERALDDGMRGLEELRRDLQAADDAAAALRAAVEEQDVRIREARHALEEIRAAAGALEVARARAEGDLAHLAQSCVDAVEATLDEVLAEVERMEQAGETTPDAAAIAADEPDPEVEEGEPAGVSQDGTGASSQSVETSPLSMTAEEAIARLKATIERLGPVNMMAIEQFDELEQRHAFLTAQRRDLVDSIAQTVEAIKRIDETSRARFTEAFTAIQANFQETFSTLFGGGRAGLTLIDENDPLESGIDIVASPPGKRLQSVQLLSGGEKALTAIALMFAIFKYKPSPFCVLDEIDAPLDDANIGRFVEMLRGMLDRTQFILITHNRRTMEIADRLYGVTMEEPGVSKLISLRLN
jgi:chromosome segregation protein